MRGDVMFIEKAFEIQYIIIESFEGRDYYPRRIYDQFSFDHAICGLVGARGVGKTTLLLKKAIEAGAKKRHALYISVDNILFQEISLLEFVDKLYKETDVRLLCIDEIHKCPNWNQILKNISDTYLDLKIIFTGSSAIDLVKSKYDLSRRVVLYPLYGFSFREYLEFYIKLSLPVITFEQLTKDPFSVAEKIQAPKILKHFKDYLNLGYYPFLYRMHDESDKYQTIEHLIQKTIYEDIAVLHVLKTPTLLVLEQLFKFVINSAPGELSVFKLSKTLKKDFESITEYMVLLEEAQLIRFLYPKKTEHAALRNPAKMYPENTNMVYAFELPLMDKFSIGKIRETFALNQLQNAGESVYYADRGDFIVNDIVFEIGGKNKTEEQIKDIKNGFILADEIVTPSKRKIPLYFLGFLY